MTSHPTGSPASGAPPGTPGTPGTPGNVAVGDELEALLCFDLYAASRAVTAAYRPILEDLGVTYPQYLVLVVLWGRDECAVKDLATTLRLDHATLTPLLRRMERAGLVTRRRSTDDERVVLVALTADGEAMRPEVERVQCQVAEALGVTPEQTVALRDLLRGVTASAGRYLED